MLPLTATLKRGAVVDCINIAYTYCEFYCDTDNQTIKLLFTLKNVGHITN